MLGQLCALVKTMQKKSKTSLKDFNSYRISKQPDMDIEITCDSCNAERDKEFHTINLVKKITFREICYAEHLKLSLSFTFILVQIVVITLVIMDLLVLKHEQNEREMHYNGNNFSYDICVNIPTKSYMYRNNQFQRIGDGRRFHCFNKTTFIRYLFEMITLSWFRRLPYSDNVREVETTVNQGFLQGSSVSDNEQDECPKSSTAVKLRNLLRDFKKHDDNKLEYDKTGMYYIYMHLDVRNVERCAGGSTEIMFKNKGNTLITDAIHHMNGLLVSQPRFYTAHLKLNKGTKSQFITTDSTQIESHWKTNIMGSVLIS